MVKTNYFNRFRKGKAKGKKQVRPPPKKPMMSFAKRVNQIISRNVENKMTPSTNYTSTICTVAGSSLSWWLVNNWDTYQFTIPQGVAEQQRIGNQIKLKRWIIKGQIHPQTEAYTTLLNLSKTTTGYIDVYFGRLNTNEEINGQLQNFLDNGSTSLAPTGRQDQIFKPVNKDAYKIYYHKRFKMAPAVNIAAGFGQQEPAANNDFALVRTFGFDVCKYICKNAVIKYDDSQTQPQNEMIRRLAMWATWTPAIGDMGIVNGARHYYQMSICSYAEYEDA